MKIARSIFSVVLIFAILFSSTGFSVSRHYCMGMLKSESFYSLSEKCNPASKSESQRPFQDEIDLDCCFDKDLNIAGIQVIGIQKSENGSSDYFAPGIFHYQNNVQNYSCTSDTESPPLIVHSRPFFYSNRIIEHQCFRI